MEKIIEGIQMAIKALTPIIPTTPISAEQIIDARYCLGKAINEALKISSNPPVIKSVFCECETPLLVAEDTQLAEECFRCFKKIKQKTV